MSLTPFLLAALTIVSPREGETVQTQKPVHRAYLNGPLAERFLRMKNPGDRAKLFAAGATQAPLHLVWSGETNAVYELSIAADGGEEDTLVLSNRTDIYVTNLEIGRTYRWLVKRPDTGETASATFMTAATAPRLLRAEGVSNFRDLGGWTTSDGCRVRQNMIFRSAGLRSSSKSSGGFFRQKVTIGERRVTDEGLETLRNDFKVKTDLELRSRQETAGMETSLLGPDANWRIIPFVAYDFIDNSVRGREPFAKIFQLFTKRENYPILMHCSGGRDRTGTLAFLLNGLLGVSEDDLCRDWEASCFSDSAASFSPDRIQRLRDYLKEMPGEGVKAKIETYVRGCGVRPEEIAAFRELMLEPVAKETTKGAMK